jgi:PAS domain-containing protein
VIDVNEAFCRMVGASREEIVGRTPLRFVEEGDRQPQAGTGLRDLTLLPTHPTFCDATPCMRLPDGGFFIGAGAVCVLIKNFSASSFLASL